MNKSEQTPEQMQLDLGIDPAGPSPAEDAPVPEDAYDATPFVPDGAGLDGLREAVAACHGCPLHRDATQAVFSAGAPDARVVLLGEQPGDSEDRRGEPFVGPAGRLLDEALEEAGIDRGDAYVTNAVKHFKFTRSGGGRRLHKSPGVREMRACAPWLEAELRLVDPQVLVALGATAGKALFGSSFRVSQQRGALLDRPDSPPVLATIHPSAVLRAEDDRERVYAGLVSDLRVVAGALA